MLSKEEHARHWAAQADNDWETVEILFAAGKFAHGLFWAHLVCEKLAKAIWILHNESNFPPRIHNLNTILEKTPLVISDELKDIMLVVNTFQTEGRYHEYVLKIEKAYDNEEMAMNRLEDVKTLITWLKRNLQ
jgi:HEPN domain-containing protein